MKRIVAWLFFLSLALIAIGLIAPSFIDWNNHKQSIIAQLQPYVQRKIDVAGNVTFRLLPNPQIMMQDVTLDNVKDAKSEAFMTLKQLEARMKFIPLLQGRFEVDTINFVEPQVNLEVLPDGSANWTDVLKPQREGAPSRLGQNADAVQLNQVTMTNGTLHYLNQVTTTEWQLDDVNLTVGADTLFGPYRVSGDLQYKKADIGIEMKTGKYEGAPVSVNIALTPVESLPVMKLDGAVDLSAGFDLTGQVSVEQGTIGSIFSSPFLGNISFLNEIASGTGMLDLKGSAAHLSDIKAKLGKQGDIAGTVTVQFAPGHKPDVTAELEGNHLEVSKSPEFVNVPEGFTAHLKLKGKDIVWQGTRLSAASLNADTDKAEWVVKNARFDLPGKSVVKLAGVVTPKNNYAAYSMDVTTEDLPKMLAAGNLGDKNILKTLGASGLIHALDWSSSVDVKNDEISLFDIDATADGKATISGVMNIAREGKSPAFQAKLTVNDLDLSAADAEGVKQFLAGLTAGGGDIEISAKNFKDGDVTLADADLKAKAGEGGFAVDHFDGHVAGASFGLSGTAAALYPPAGYDLKYTFKADHPAAAAKLLGISLPPPLTDAAAGDMSGTLTEKEGAYAFSVESAGMTVSGTATKDAAGLTTYKNDIHVKNATWAQMGLPVDRLFGATGPVDFTASFAGTRDAYTLSNLKAGDVTGTVTHSDGKSSGDITADKTDLDAWFGGGWTLTNPLQLNIKTKKLIWRGNEVADAGLQLNAGPKKVEASHVTGTLWGGAVSADASAARQDTGVWDGALKASIAGPDFHPMMTALGLGGFTIGKGTLDVDLASDGAKAGKGWYEGASGDLHIKADTLTVEKYNAAKIPGFIGGIKDTPPPDIAGQIARLLKGGGATTFRNVDGTFKLAAGKLSIGKLQLADSVSRLDVDGAEELGPQRASLTATVQLKQPPGVPSFTVDRAGELKNLPDYTVNSKAIENQLIATAKPPPPADDDAAAKSGAAAAANPNAPLQGPPAAVAPPALSPDETQEPGLPSSYTTSPDKPGVAAPADNTPVEAEPLAPVTPAPEAPAAEVPGPQAPETPSAAPAAPASPEIKGILDRLDDTATPATPAQ